MILNKEKILLRRNIVKLVDNMIPEEKNKLLPKASKAIDLKNFINTLIKNKNFIREFKLFLKKQKQTKILLNKLSFETENKLTTIIEEELINFYFSSPRLKKKLGLLTSNKLKGKKTVNINILVKNIKRNKILSY